MRLYLLLPLLTENAAIIKIVSGKNNRKLYEGLFQSMPTELRLLDIEEILPYKVIRRKNINTTKAQYGICFVTNKKDKTTRAHIEHIGEKHTMKNGHKAQVTSYNSATDITITFDDGTVREHQRYHDFTHGEIKHKSELPGRVKPKDHTGETSVSNKGENITIVKYLNNQYMNVQFDDGTIAYGVNYYAFVHRKIVKPDYKHYKWFIAQENTEPEPIQLQDIIDIIMNDRTLTSKEQCAKLGVITHGKKSKNVQIFVLHKNVKCQIICAKE